MKQSEYIDILYPTLLSLWLNDYEASIYLACQSHGAIPVSKIAQIITMKRTSVYNHIGTLIKKQIVVETKSAWWTLYSAQHPDIIISLLKQEQKRFDTMIHQIEDIKDSWIALWETGLSTPKIKYYQWKESVFATYEKYKKSHQWFAFFDAKAACIHLNCTPEHLAWVFANVDDEVKEIIIDNEYWKLYSKYIKNPKHHIKFLQSPLETLQVDTIGFDWIIHYITYDTTNLVVEITHNWIYQSQKILFNEVREKL